MEPVEVVLEFMNRINARNVDALCELMTEDHLFIDALGMRIKGRENMRGAWKMYYTIVPDYIVSHEEILQKGNLVAVFGTARGTLAPEGKMEKKNSWEIPASWLAVVRDGRVAEWRVYADNQPIRKLMGEPVP